MIILISVIQLNLQCHPIETAIRNFMIVQFVEQFYSKQDNLGRNSDLKHTHNKVDSSFISQFKKIKLIKANIIIIMINGYGLHKQGKEFFAEQCISTNKQIQTEEIIQSAIIMKNLEKTTFIVKNNFTRCLQNRLFLLSVSTKCFY